MRTTIRSRGRHTIVIPLAMVLCIAMAAPAQAHEPADGVQADHAYAADPLFSMASGVGLFPGHSPDAPTAMASTTKVMSLIIALEAVKNGAVSMDDDVTISFAATAQPPLSSMMRDDSTTTLGCGVLIGAGAPLALGEVVSLEDLLFGMMIPSGNDAAVAIAEHVARGYLGSFGTVAYFVTLMNNKAAALGLSGTFYQNPVGYDTPLHWTTARHLARLWSAGMADSEFRRIVRPQTWVATGKFGSTTKTYTMTKCGGYPGLEGHKNGRSTDCKGDQDECFVASARRIGRRVIVAGMQADGGVGGTTGDAAEMFDAAFNRLFHPDPRGASGLSNAASKLSLVCPATNRAVTVTLPSTGRAQIVSWNTNVAAQTYTVAGSATAPTGSLAPISSSEAREIDAIALSSTRVVTATNVGTSVELRLWNLPATGAPTLVGPAVGARTAGSARSFELVKLGSTMFASAARSTGDQLVLKTWRSTATGLVLLKSWTTTVAVGVTEVDVASAPGQQSLRFVTVVRRAAGLPMVQSWEVDAVTGAITGDPSQLLPEAVSGLSIVPAPVEALPDEFIVEKFYAIGYRRSNGGLGLIYTRVRSNGELGGLSALTTAGGISAIELAPFGTSGIVSLTRVTNGTLKPIVWETRRNANGTVTGLRISDHQASTTGLEPEICATPSTKAEGDFITGLREGFGAIVRLRGWRIGDRP